MATTPADLTVSQANQVISLCTQLVQLRNQIAPLIAVNAVTPLQAKWQALKTTAMTSDGQLGTADSGAPVQTNPIDPRVYLVLNRAISSADLGAALQVLFDLNTFLLGTAVGTNLARPAQLNVAGLVV